MCNDGGRVLILFKDRFGFESCAMMEVGLESCAVIEVGFESYAMKEVGFES
jgi:hypothetical protein